MSQKPGKATEEDKKKRKHKKKTKQILTRAVTHIRLIEANPGKLDALDQLVVVFQALCQRYVTLLCLADSGADKYADPVFETELSDRWHRVAMQQAAGIAGSWRTNRQVAYDAYLEDVADYAETKAKAEACGVPLDLKRKEPAWREWNLPVLRVPAIRRSTTGSEFLPSTKGIPCVSQSNWPPIIKKPSKAGPSTPPPRSTSATVSGGLP